MDGHELGNAGNWTDADWWLSDWRKDLWTDLAWEQESGQSDGDRNRCDDWNDKIEKWVQNEKTEERTWSKRIASEVVFQPLLPDTGAPLHEERVIACARKRSCTPSSTSETRKRAADVQTEDLEDNVQLDADESAASLPQAESESSDERVFIGNWEHDESETHNQHFGRQSCRR